jgi:hypothetical protein
MYGDNGHMNSGSAVLMMVSMLAFWVLLALGRPLTRPHHLDGARACSAAASERPGGGRCRAVRGVPSQTHSDHKALNRGFWSAQVLALVTSFYRHDTKPVQRASKVICMAWP